LKGKKAPVLRHHFTVDILDGLLRLLTWLLVILLIQVSSAVYFTFGSYGTVLEIRTCD
jgi:hypothetical protein